MRRPAGNHGTCMHENKKYTVQDDEYKYHDSLQARPKREMVILLSVKILLLCRLGYVLSLCKGLSKDGVCHSNDVMTLVNPP